jgi:hypothetical protein
VLERYRQVGALIYRTDQQGAITIDTDGRTYRVTPFVQPRRPRGRTPTQAVEDWLTLTQFGQP